MRRSLAATAVIFVLLSACSSSETKGSGTDAGSTEDANVPIDAGPSGTSDDAEVDAPITHDAAVPQAPQLTMLMPMMGGLHLRWNNKEASCDSIEGERKTSTVDYKVVFTVSGEADNKHDATATGNVDYTYRLRCKKGGVYSAYSNEMTGNPTK